MPVDWLSAALLSAAILGAVGVVDSHMLSKRMPSYRSYLLVMGIILTVISIVVIFKFPLGNLAAWSLAAAVLAGIFRAGSAVLLLYALKSEEVSIVIPVASTYPITVAILAMPILGEFLSLAQWIAIIIVVLGVVLSSLKQRIGHRVTWLGKKILLPLVSSLLLASSDITAKYALGDISPWGMYAITSLCVAVTFLAISLRPSVSRELARMPKRNTSLLIIAVNEVLVVTSRILFYWAMGIGSVSLVSTVSSTRPIFVFIFAFTISRFSPLLYEYESDTRILLFRFLATALIVGGVAIIYLT